jgi:phosphoribosylformylglycinamidine synthase PurS subunit
MIALGDLESERNIATHNAMTEKASHARTIGQLDEANKTIQQLTLDGTRLRAAVSSNMHNIGLASISNVRIGKHITLEVEAADQASAEAQVKEACEKLLANQIMEAFTFTMEAVETVA